MSNDAHSLTTRRTTELWSMEDQGARIIIFFLQIKKEMIDELKGLQSTRGFIHLLKNFHSSITK